MTPPRIAARAREAALRAALAQNPGQAEKWNALGNLLRAEQRPEEALEAYRRAVFLDPGDGRYRGNLGTALVDLQRPEEALVWLTQAVAAAPADAQARVNLGGALMLTARPQAALAHYRAAQALSPGLAAATFGIGLALLTLGAWPSGWEAYEARLADPAILPAARDLSLPRWHGPEPLAGKRLLLLAEQGLGDTILAARYLPLLAQRGAEVVLQVPTALQPLLRPLAAEVVTPGTGLRGIDLWCPLLSLPRAFATTLQTVPPAPYLAVPPTRQRRWRQALGSTAAFRVGLAWSGNPNHRYDRLRSLPPARLAPLLALAGVEVHALSPEARAEDPRIRCHPEIGDFADTAALASLMDAVVSVDTAVAHLAGALGRPTFILLAHAADFRWMLDRNDTPWYPTARLIRQPRPGAWEEVIAEAKVQLSALVLSSRRGQSR